MSDITITGATVYKATLPVRSERRQGRGTTKGSITNVFLRLDTDAGIAGWGEAATSAAFPGATEAHMAALDVHLRPLLVGADPFRIEWLMERADRCVVHCAEAKAAMEMALFDIVGHALGTPVHTLLGGAVRDEIPLSFSIANPDLGADLEMAKALYAEGLRIFKVKTGFAGHAEDLRRLEALRCALPGDVDLRVDYNQGLDVFDAIPKLRDIEVFAPTFIEQPVALDRIEAMAAITRAIDTPIMADESVSAPADAHAVAATPNVSLGCEFYQATYYPTEDLLAEPFPVRDGHVQVPTGPGLGIAVDEERLKKYTVERSG